MGGCERALIFAGLARLTVKKRAYDDTGVLVAPTGFPVFVAISGTRGNESYLVHRDAHVARAKKKKKKKLRDDDVIVPIFKAGKVS